MLVDLVLGVASIHRTIDPEHVLSVVDLVTSDNDESSFTTNTLL